MSRDCVTIALIVERSSPSSAKPNTRALSEMLLRHAEPRADDDGRDRRTVEYVDTSHVDTSQSFIPEIMENSTLSRVKHGGAFYRKERPSLLNLRFARIAIVTGWAASKRNIGYPAASKIPNLMWVIT